MRTIGGRLLWLVLLALGLIYAQTAMAAGPSLEVTVDHAVIKSGEKATISWHATGTKYCQMSHGIGLLRREGSVEVSPSQTTTYTITAYGTKWRSHLDEAARKAQEAVATITVQVVGVPPMAAFAPSSFSIYQGDSVDLSWTVDNADRCVITPGIGAVPTNGKMTVRPDQTTEYVLTASGPGGTVTSKIKVIVNPRANH